MAGLAVIHRDITDEDGSILDGAVVTIRKGHASGGDLADIYADAAGVTALSNPVTVNGGGSGSPSAGVLSVYAAPGAYRLEGTSSAGGGVSLIDAGARPTDSYDTRAAFVSGVADGFWDDAPDGTVVYADGLAYKRSAGATALTDLPNWVPAGFAAYPQHFGGLVNGVWDTTFHLWIEFLYTWAVPGYVPKGTYPVNYIRDRAITGGISITMSPDATIIGTQTKVDVAGDNAITSYEVTEFTAGNDGLLVVYITGGVQTVWTEGTEYTVSGQTFDWNAGSDPHGALATGDTVRIVSRDSMVELGQQSGTPSNYITWIGGTIDNSQRGFAPGFATGSGLLFYDTDLYEVANVVFDGGDDCYSNRDNGFTDSGLTTVNCNSGQVRGCKFIGQADLGYYVSGGADSGDSDNTIGHEIHGNWFRRCWLGGKTERQVTSINVHDNTFEECQGDWLIAGVAQDVGGGRAHIHHNTSLRSRTRGFDVRRSFDVQIDTNTIIDFGYELDGETAVNTSWAIDIAGGNNCSVKNNIIRMDALDRANQVGVRVRNESTLATLQSTNTTVIGNKIDGLLLGIDENNAGTGNVFRENEITNTTTEIDVLSTRRWHYRNSNSEYEGIGSTPFTGFWTPELRVNNVAMGGTVNKAVGRYRRQGNMANISCELNVALPATFPATGPIEIWGIPYYGINTADVQWGASVTRVGRIGASGEVISVELPTGSNQLRPFKITTGGTTDSITDADLTANTTMSIFFSMVYEVEPEAVN